MLNLLLEAQPSFFQKYGIYIILAVFLVVMILTTLIPNKKRKKEREELMTNLKTGTRLKTIGGLVGVIKSIDNAKNEIIIDVGANDQVTLITIGKEAIYTLLTENTTTEPIMAEKEEIALTVDDAEAQKKVEEKSKSKITKKTGNTNNLSLSKDDSSNLSLDK